MTKESGFIPTICAKMTAGALMAFALSAPAHAGSNEGLEDRVSVLENKAAASHDLDMSQRIEDLQDQVQNLSGRLEVATHDIEMLQQRQQALYADLDRRISKLPKTPNPAFESTSKVDSYNTHRVNDAPAPAATAATAAAPDTQLSDDPQDSVVHKDLQD